MAAMLSSLTVTGLRCLDGMSITFDPLTALIGANGAGKSTSIQALQFLFGQTSLDDADCTDGATDTEVVVTGKFTHLTEDWVEKLRPWLDRDENLILTRIRVPANDGRATDTWTTNRWQAPGFGAIRAALAQNQPADPLKALWSAAQAVPGSTLPVWSSKAKALEVLASYEGANPTQVTEASADSSLRFGSGGQIDLTGMIELLVLPALRDASQDAGETRGSTLGRLVDLTVRSGMDLDAELAALTTSTTEAYAKLLSKAGDDKLAELSRLITVQLSSFAPGSTVSLAWDPKMPVLTSPPVRARITESGHEAEVGRQGHGVQRAYVFSLLRALLEARRSDGTARPGLILAIEEPEVYQHPVRARYVARVLNGLARDTETSTQVLYTTHSPFFVSVDNVSSIRLLRLTTDTTPGKDAAADQPRIPEPPRSDEPLVLTGLEIPPHANHGAGAGTTSGGSAMARTRATAPSLHDIAARLEESRKGTGQPWTVDRVAAQLPGLLGTTVSEGFFADAVALVEGDEDAGYLQGAADARGIDFTELGIAIISVRGKDPLPLAHEIFRAVGIPTYVVFDTDVKASGVTDSGALRLNSMLTWLLAGTAEEKPGTAVGVHHASVDHCLRSAIEAQIEPTLLSKALTDTIREMGLSKDAVKNGHVVRVAIERLYGEGPTSGTLDAIVDSICQLSPHHAR